MANLNNSYFKSVVVEGVTKEEALAKSGFNAESLLDVTQSYKNYVAKNGAPSAEDFKEWQIKLDQDRVKGAPGVGFVITLDKAVENKKENSFVRRNAVRSKDTQVKRVSAFDLYAGDKYLGRVWPEKSSRIVTDSEGNKVERDFYTLNKKKGMDEGVKLANELGLTEDVIGKYVKADINGNDVAFTLEYVPTKNTHNGKYIVFGVVNA